MSTKDINERGVTNYNRFPIDGNKRICVFQDNLDGYTTAMAFRKVYKYEEFYFVNGYDKGSQFIVNLIKDFDNKFKDIQEIMLFNIKLAQYNVNDLNGLVDKGVSVFYFGYLFRPMNLNGTVTFSPEHTTLTCLMELMRSTKRFTTFVPEELEVLNKLNTWSEIGMKYRGDYNSTLYIEETMNILGLVSNNIDSLLYPKEYVKYVLGTLDYFLQVAGRVDHIGMFYHGRISLAKQLVRSFNLIDGSHINMTVADIILIGMKNKYEYSTIHLTGQMDGVKGIIVYNSPFFNKHAKNIFGDNPDVDFVINVRRSGYCQVRSTNKLDVRTVNKYFGDEVEDMEGEVFAGGLRLRNLSVDIVAEDFIPFIRSKYDIRI